MKKHFLCLFGSFLIFNFITNAQDKGVLGINGFVLPNHYNIGIYFGYSISSIDYINFSFEYHRKNKLFLQSHSRNNYISIKTLELMYEKTIFSDRYQRFYFTAEGGYNSIIQKVSSLKTKQNLEKAYNNKFKAHIFGFCLFANIKYFISQRIGVSLKLGSNFALSKLYNNSHFLPNLRASIFYTF